MNAPLRNPERDLSDAAAGLLRQQAIENISERIKGGRSKVSVHDLLDTELDDPKRCRILAEDLAKLLTAESGERATLADRIVDGLVERHISVHGDLVEEEAAEIEAHAGEDA